MAGRPKRRQRLNSYQTNYGNRWCDRPGFVGPSKGSPLTVLYHLCTVHGWFTVHESYVCWLVAQGNSITSSFRRVYWPFKRTGRQRQLKPKQKLWIEDLKRMDAEGIIDLSMDPWEVYGFNIGNKEEFYAPPRRDYSDVGFGNLQQYDPFGTGRREEEGNRRV